jgi:predicted RNA-binding protein YlxR (DUF448 family)
MAEKHVPMRTCIGCRKTHPQNELIRLTARDGKLVIDRTGRMPGRGLYVCRREECINRILKSRSFNRAFRTNFDYEMIERLHAGLLDMLKEVSNGEKNI